MCTASTHSTGLRACSLSAKVFDFINQNKLGLLGIAAAAEVMSADCRFNYWVATKVKKRRLPDDWWLRFLENTEINEDRCLAAMKDFSSGGKIERLYEEFREVVIFLCDRSLPPEVSSGE